MWKALAEAILDPPALAWRTSCATLRGWGWGAEVSRDRASDRLGYDLPLRHGARGIDYPVSITCTGVAVDPGTSSTNDSVLMSSPAPPDGGVASGVLDDEVGTPGGGVSMLTNSVEPVCVCVSLSVASIESQCTAPSDETLLGHLRALEACMADRQDHDRQTGS